MSGEAWLIGLLICVAAGLFVLWIAIVQRRNRD
jgi:hypothetical protein